MCKLHKRKRTRAYRFSGGIRPSLRNGFTAYSALSPVTGFLATVAHRIFPRSLTPASGRQDHTTSPSASACVRRSQAPRPPHPTARFVTCATPLSSGETRGVKPLICPTAKAKYFSQEGWTGFFDLPVGQIGRIRKTAVRHCEPSDAIQSAARLGGRGLLLGRNRTQPWGTLSLGAHSSAGLVHCHRNSVLAFTASAFSKRWL